MVRSSAAVTCWPLRLKVTRVEVMEVFFWCMRLCPKFPCVLYRQITCDTEAPRLRGTKSRPGMSQCLSASVWQIRRRHHRHHLSSAHYSTSVGKYLNTVSAG